MALIPGDVGLRLRLETEAQLLQPTRPVAEIPSDLPELRQGQRFSARIQEALPDNTYRALVAGKSLTLSLPEGAKPGDTLELVVVDRSAKVVVARPATAGPAADAQSPYPHATLSRAAQLIGTLLPAEGDSAAPVPLNRGAALLSHPPQNAAALAPALAVAVKQSGVFYEAHQAQWASGRLPMETLLQEPQGRLSHPVSSAEPELAEHATRRTEGFPRDTAAFVRPSQFAGGETAASTESTANSLNARAAAIPDEIRPVVQQQLDAVATQRLAWHGEVWPGQHMEWEIEWDEQNRAQPGEADDRWTTSLRLAMPRLGLVEARLQLDGPNLNVAMLAADTRRAEQLRAEAPALEAALNAGGIQLRGMMVRANDTP